KGASMSEPKSQDRRQFLGAAAATFAVTSLGAIASARAQAGNAAAAAGAGKTGAGAAFGPIQQINAGLLNIGYAEAGPATGHPVLLLHGWPYDIHSYVEVAPLLAAKGFRVIVPFIRGYGSTRFLSNDTFRNGQQSAVAQDIIALMDALKIQKAILGGFDWGSRTVGIMAVLWPERCRGIVAVSGYLITNLKANLQPLPPMAEYGWWYQYYFAIERGKLGYAANRFEFNKLIWK